MTTRRIFLLATFVFGATSLSAQSKPDFTGRWELNIGKSNFDKQPPPKPMTLTVEHKDPNLTESILHEGDAEPGVVKYVTDGSEGSNIVRGNPLKCTAKWEGSTLIITTWGAFGPNEIKLIDKWSLSDDGKTWITARHYEGPGGPQDQKLVAEKVEKKP